MTVQLLLMGYVIAVYMTEKCAVIPYNYIFKPLSASKVSFYHNTELILWEQFN